MKKESEGQEHGTAPEYRVSRRSGLRSQSILGSALTMDFCEFTLTGSVHLLEHLDISGTHDLVFPSVEYGHFRL